MPDMHAKLGPSSALRWLNCTPSAELESHFPSTSSKYADEGTLAHSIVEERLNRVIKGKPRGVTGARLKKKEEEMGKSDAYFVDHCDEYVTFVTNLFDKLKADKKEPVMFSERQVEFTEWVPDGFGTTDTIIIADGTMYVFDFKFGANVRVSAELNPQLRLYALGAYNEFSILYDIDTVVTYIIQPRVENGTSNEEISVNDLLEWANTYVKPRAALAAEGSGECIEGAWCKFCRAKTICKARAVRYLDFLHETMQAPKLLSNEELARILPLAEYITGWARELKDWMLDQAVNRDESYPGYKLVEGRSNRVVLNEAALASKLEKAGYKDIYVLKGLTDLESICGKARFAEIAGGLVDKPTGKPTLVPEEDPRPAIGRGKDMFNDEKEFSENG